MSGTSLVPLQAARSKAPLLPALVQHAGPAAQFAWDEFFGARVRNPHTRAAYLRAVRRFLAWVELSGVTLAQITPSMVGGYLDQHSGGPSGRKLSLAALRAFFDCLVNRHVCMLNPAATVRGEKYQVMEGLTPEITPVQARLLLDSIETTTIAGLRDRSIIGILIFTAARAGAVARLKLRHLKHDGSQYVLRFAEKGGKQREIPIRHDLQGFLLAYLAVTSPSPGPGEEPLFRTLAGRSDILTKHGITAIDICRLVKRRLKDAGLPARLSPHSFRVCTVTDLLTQGIALEEVQYLAGHADPRTTRLYDRRQKRVTRNIVERISI